MLHGYSGVASSSTVQCHDFFLFFKMQIYIIYEYCWLHCIVCESNTWMFKKSFSQMFAQEHLWHYGKTTQDKKGLEA